MGKLVAGGVLTFIALFMLLGFFNVDSPMSAPVAALTFLVSVVLPGAGAAGLFYLHAKERRAVSSHTDALRLQTHKSEIVRLAIAKGGKVTAVEVLAEAGLSPQDGERALRGLVEDGVADIEVTESGLMVYAFHDVQALPEKEKGKSVLDR